MHFAPENVIAVLVTMLRGRRGTRDDFAAIPFHFVLFSAALVELAKSIPVHSISSVYLFFFPLNELSRIVFVKLIQKALRIDPTTFVSVS